MKFFYIFLIIFLNTNNLVLFAFSSYDATADHLYNNRRKSPSKANKAAKHYENIIKTSSSLAIKQNAMERYARLAILLGELGEFVYKPVPKKNKYNNMFKKCVALTDELSPTKINRHVAEYYYWRAVCLGLQIKNGSYWFNIRHLIPYAREIKSLTEEGTEKFSSYDAGGFYRIKAAMHLKAKKYKVPFVSDPQEAQTLIKKAINYSPEFYLNYRFLAEALVLEGKENDALQLLNEMIPELKEKIKTNGFTTIPNEIENIAVLGELRKYRGKIKKRYNLN